MANPIQEKRQKNQEKFALLNPEELKERLASLHQYIEAIKKECITRIARILDSLDINAELSEDISIDHCGYPETEFDNECYIALSKPKGIKEKPSEWARNIKETIEKSEYPIYVMVNIDQEGHPVNEKAYVQLAFDIGKIPTTK